MKVAHIADTHLSERPGPSGVTLDEQVAQLEWIGDDAAEQGARAMLHGGDLYDGDNGGRPSTPAERDAAETVISGWASRMPVVIVRGNHDHPRDLRIFERLRTPHPVVIAEIPRVVPLLDGELRVACLPWPRKALLAQWSGATSGLELDEALVAGLRAVLGGLGTGWSADDGCRVLLAHAELGSALLDNGQPLVGRCDVPLSESDLLGVGADAVLLGHVHRHQVVAGPGGRGIVYAGGPRAFRFGEEGPKGYCLVDCGRGQDLEVEHREAPGRLLLTVVGEYCAGTTTMTTDAFRHRPAGAAVRLVYEVDEASRSAAAEAARYACDALLAEGAHSVKLVPNVITTHRVRSCAIVGAKTMEARLRAEWETRGLKPSREAQIVAKLRQVEEETA